MINGICYTCGGRTSKFIQTNNGTYCVHCGGYVEYFDINKLKERTKKLSKIISKMKR